MKSWSHRLLWVAAIVASAPTAQWTQVFPSQSPGPRAGAAMAHDEVRNKTILLGGDATDGSTWAWDGTTWGIAASTGPSPRFDAAMATVAANNTVVLFGGWAAGPVGDTWVWNGTWSRASGGGAPAARHQHAMAYDPVRARVVMFGGNWAVGPLSDTWEWDGTSWQAVAVTGPGARAGHAMAWDPVRRTVVMFGGTLNAELWEWNGAVWSLITASGPAPRSGHRMVSSPRGVLLFGGVGQNDTWVWDGSRWQDISGATRPPARVRSTLALAPNGILLYGGNAGATALGDTWLLSGGLLTLPDAALTTEGNAGLPFGDAPRRRMQTVIAVGAFPPFQRAGLLRSVRVRRDAGATPFLGRSLDLRIVLGVAGTSPRTMSTNFLANWRGTPTLVYQGTVALPDAPPVQPGPAPFGAPLTFQSPFLWNAQDLALELEVAGTSLLAPYDIDAQAQLHTSGSVTPFGVACAGAHGTPALILPDPLRLLPGGTLDTGVTGAWPGAIAFGFLGDSDTQWLGLPLPFPWPGTNCFVYHNWVLTSSMPVQSDGSARIGYPIPGDPGLAGRRLFTQSGVYEGAASFPPLVLTSAARLTIGAAPPVYWDTITNADGSFTGTKLSGRYLTPVLQLDLN